MSKSFTDRELKTQFQKLNRDQLEAYLIQVVRQLEKYKAEELTNEEETLLANLATEKAILEEKLTKLTKDNNITKRYYAELNKKHTVLEQEKAALLNENQTLKIDQEAAIKVYSKLKNEKAGAEKKRDKFQENLIAANKKINDLEENSNSEREERKKVRQKIIELEDFQENLIDQNLLLENERDQERKKYEQEKIKVARSEQKQYQVESILEELAQ